MIRFLIFFSALMVSLSTARGSWSIEQVTDNPWSASVSSFHNGGIAWEENGGGDYRFEIFYWNGTATTQVTHNMEDDTDPSTYNGTIAWHGFDGNDHEIFYWDGTITTQITDNVEGDYEPSLYSGTIAWYAHDGNDFEIFYWNGKTTTQITDNQEDDIAPSVYNGKIAWMRDDGNDYEVFYWDGVTTTQITDNLRNDYAPSLYDGTIAWAYHGINDFEIFYWDGATTTQITDNLRNDYAPSLYDGTIAWYAYDGNDFEIFYWDGTTTTQVTDNDLPDQYPSLCKGAIAWSQVVDGESQVFFAYEPTLISGSVVSAIDLATVPYVSVNVSSGDRWSKTTTTDAEGGFYFTGVPLGPVSIQVEDPDYWPVSRSVTTTGSTLSGVTVVGIPQNVVTEIREGMYTQEELNDAVIAAVPDSDGDGFTDEQEVTLETDPEKYLLHLKCGWNLVSLARVPETRTTEHIFQGYAITNVYVWDALSKCYKITETVDPLKGHWVLIERDVDIEFILPNTVAATPLP